MSNKTYDRDRAESMRAYMQMQETLWEMSWMLTEDAEFKLMLAARIRRAIKSDRATIPLR